MGSKRSRIKRLISRGKYKDPRLLASCVGKIRYESYEAAKLEAEKLPRFIKPYKCQYGNHYHKGRKKSKQGKE